MLRPKTKMGGDYLTNTFPLFFKKPFETVLDVDCGLGGGVLELRKRQYEAYKWQFKFRVSFRMVF
jgi:hypothetical protein